MTVKESPIAQQNRGAAREILQRRGRCHKQTELFLSSRSIGDVQHHAAGAVGGMRVGKDPDAGIFAQMILGH